MDTIYSAEKRMHDIIQSSDMNRLYYNYKRTTDEDIKELLTGIKIVQQHEGTYFELSEKSMDKVKARPRNCSLNFDAYNIDFNKKFKGESYGVLIFLVKSTSRFFLKADIGEIFDQMSREDKMACKAIVFDPGRYINIDNTDGEHFLMEAILLK